MENQAYKERRKRINTISAQDIPNGYVPTASFEEKYRGDIRKLIYQGKIPAVRLNVGKGVLYINKSLGNKYISVIKDRKQKDSPKHDVTSESGESLTFISSITIFNKLSELIEVNNSILTRLWRSDNEEDSAVYISNKNFKQIDSKLDNLCRHIAIQEALLFGIIEELGIQKKCFDKEAAKERVKQLSRLITQEDWDEGFEL